MPSFTATIPVLVSILALASAGELPLTPLATYPAARPTPAPYQPGVPIVHRPIPATMPPTQRKQEQPSVLHLSSQAPTATGTPTDKDKCSHVAARITPQLTPKPTYPPSLKTMADKLGGVDSDMCENVNLSGKFKNIDPADMNRFNQARYSTFIVPLWAKVHELWAACGPETSKLEAIAKEPCYRWALELSKKSNASSFDQAFRDNQAQGGEKNKLGNGNEQGIVRTPETDAGVSHTAAVGLVGMVTLLLAVMLA
ncbi:hypothetical protein N657DRAFT_648745 [Parathielavia appendiculata]|uniref:Uncharacterized protein n=1 Tax=Parathielavia appendiculata TaxID=2587402 RepID=A0AAN6TU97_9PEZI|nr:hypothetical protein N657DRAFT_648745 [Parathielavia appendiculata]